MLFLTESEVRQLLQMAKAIELKPDFRGANLLLARLYSGSGRQQKALEDLDRVLAKNPKDIPSV